MSRKEVSKTNQMQAADVHAQSSTGTIMENAEPEEKKPKLDADCSTEIFDRKIELHQRATNDNSQLQIVSPNQVVAIDATEPKPAIFKLDADCWDEIFDCLSYEDVKSFGQTCTVFEGVVGKYFQWQYTRSVPFLEDDDFEENPNFIKYMKSVKINEDTTYSVLGHIASNCKDVNELTIECDELDQLKIEAIGNILNKVKHLFMNSCVYDDETFKTIIESCGNLKEITIIGDFPSSWPDRHYSKFQNLILDSSMDMNILIPHIQKNSSVINLSITTNHLLDHRNDMLNSNIELDTFVMQFDDGEDIDDIDDLIDILNELHKKGFYKKLLVYSFEKLSTAQLLGLPGKIYLVIDTRTKLMKYPVLPNVMGLEIRNHCDMETSKFNMNALAKSFVNLNTLNIYSECVDDLLPFIRQSVKLKNVTFRECGQKEHEETLHCNISALNGERKKLKGACKVTIHVDEDIYLVTKWGKVGTALDLVEIKRNECRNADLLYYTHYDKKKYYD